MWVQNNELERQVLDATLKPVAKRLEIDLLRFPVLRSGGMPARFL